MMGCMKASARSTRKPSMKQSSIIAAFAKWLDAHRERLPAPLVCTARKGDRRVYRFRGVPSLRIMVGSESFFAEVMYRRKYIDELLIVDVAEPRRSKAGRWYCGTCKAEGHAEYMKDRMTLLTSHTFEKFLDWCQEEIREDSLLVVEEGPGTCTTAHIFSPKELKSHWKRLHPGFIVEPLFRASGSVPARRARPRPSRK
jgi:hypothetical protein